MLVPTAGGRRLAGGLLSSTCRELILDQRDGQAADPAEGWAQNPPVEANGP
jgi:hypothetical protein